jgi:hypothetical protein
MHRKIDLHEAPAFIEREFLHVLDTRIAPNLSGPAAVIVPIVKKGLQLLRQIIEKRGHKDAEQMLDMLLASPAEKL